MIEEFYGRGLFLNIIEAFAYKKDNKAEIAIIVSSVVFGLIDICALPYCFTQNMRYCSVQRKGGTELIYQKGCKPWRSITNKRLLV